MGQTGVMGDLEGLEEGVTSSCACTLPGTVMENDGNILQGIALLHMCSGAGVGEEWQPLSPSALCRAPCRTLPLPDLSQL